MSSSEQQKSMENYHVTIAGRQKEIIEEIQNISAGPLQFKSFKTFKALATEWIVNDMVQGLYHSEHYNVKTLEDAYRILSREKDVVNKLEQCEFDYILKKSTIQLEPMLPKEMKRLSELKNEEARYFMLILFLAQALLAVSFWPELIESEQLKLELRKVFLIAVSAISVPMYLLYKEGSHRALSRMFMKTTRKYAQAALRENLSKQPLIPR